ncbi:hypothetical protein OE88DRAFT_1642521 [Heliocybe sulcata]|uniref:Uncharacterized protein n=1 Tax=Heliocybe sulcata TaxID=5364 RepID=A0A5C3NEE2_9AGAM|nr:hypothetical protein OE88DRAFT_1642521 [Heliocybe sulcata]
MPYQKCCSKLWVIQALFLRGNSDTEMWILWENVGRKITLLQALQKASDGGYITAIGYLSGSIAGGCLLHFCGTLSNKEMHSPNPKNVDDRPFRDGPTGVSREIIILPCSSKSGAFSKCVTSSSHYAIQPLGWKPLEGIYHLVHVTFQVAEILAKSLGDLHLCMPVISLVDKTQYENSQPKQLVLPVLSRDESSTATSSASGYPMELCLYQVQAATFPNFTWPAPAPPPVPLSDVTHLLYTNLKCFCALLQFIELESIADPPSYNLHLQLCLHQGQAITLGLTSTYKLLHTGLQEWSIRQLDVGLLVKERVLAREAFPECADPWRTQGVVSKRSRLVHIGEAVATTLEYDPSLRHFRNVLIPGGHREQFQRASACPHLGHCGAE